MSIERALDRDTQVNEPPFPFEQAVVILHDHGEVMGAADARMALWCVGPLKEGDDRARVADLVTEVEVVAAGVIKVDGFFHEALAEDLCVEIDGALGV